MRDAQEILYSLLDNIDELCRIHRLDYYLIGDELLWAYTGRKHFRCKADICMTYEAFKNIEDELRKIPGRVTEGLFKNGEMPGVYNRLVDISSFMLELPYHKVIKETGIAVNIHIIRRVCSASREIEKLEEIMDMGIEGVKRKISKKDMYIFNKLKNSCELPERTEKLLEECKFDPHIKEHISSETSLKLPGLDVLMFPGDIWSKISTVTVAGRKYMTVNDTEKYLKIHYGDPTKVIAHSDTFLNKVIVDAAIPYVEIKDSISEALCDKDYWENRNALYKEYFGRYDALVKERSRLDDYVRAASERITLMKKYYPIKECILCLLEDKRIDELRLVFSDMEKSIKKYEPSGLLCVFDKEIWDAYIEMLKIEGYTERAEKLAKLYRDNPFEEIKNAHLLVKYGNTGKKAVFRNIIRKKSIN